MPLPSETQKRRAFRVIQSRGATRETILAALAKWNRNQMARIIFAIFVVWVVGSLGIHLAERNGNNKAFDTWQASFWSVWVMLFAGPDQSPETSLGRLLAMILLGAGVGLIGLFTGTVASMFVEKQLRRREVSTFEMDEHLILCNWAPRGLPWIREVHSKIISDKRPVVIVHDNPEEIELPDKQDEAAFNDVYIVKGDPTNEVVLRRAKAATAHSIVILSDDRQGEYADGKTIMTCIALRNLCRGDHQPNITVECRNPNNRHHLKKAGADDIISSDEFGLRLMARAALFHGMTRVYQELLTVGHDANELYLLAMPEELVGREFVEVAQMFLRHRNDRRSCLLIGVQRNEEMILNPIGQEAGPLKSGDELILLSRVFHNPSQTLPTVPVLQQVEATPPATPSK